MKLELTHAVVFVLAATAFASPMAVLADDSTETQLPDPGMLPDSPFYVLKTFGEAVRMAFTFNETEKVKLHVELAENRLAEAEKMQAANNTRLSQKALERYREQLGEVENGTERLKLRNLTVEGIDEYMNRTTSKHIAVLTRVLAKAPDAAKPGLENALANAEEHQDKIRTRLVEWATTSGKNVTTVIRNKTVSTQCVTAADCANLPHVMVLGRWECDDGKCKWAMNETTGDSPASNVRAGKAK
jgi:hypothetical protein